MRFGRKARFVAPGILALACGGGPSFDGHVFKNDQLSFRVANAPGGFRPVAPDGALLAYRDDEEGATIALSGRCGKDGDDVPLEALTHHLFLQFTERNVESQEKFTLDGREALRTTLTAKLDGVEKHFSVVVLKKNGCVYDFLMVERAGGSHSAEQRFSEFVEGFRSIAP
ncbi:MAG TPA: hypothetical protein VHE30_00240 [Polyangiaceae bacterium]|nr:hypothetical protein [Polyangiaceae bacterium]